MKNLVINFTKCSPNSTIASNRIATFISKQTGFLLVDDLQTAQQIKQEMIGAIYVVNGMFGFCNFRDECVRLCYEARQLFWIGNDYNIKVPSQLKRFEFIKACQYTTSAKEYLLDWNKLTYLKGLPIQNKIETGILYYGAYRENRQEAFKRYFKTDIYKIIVSTTPKNKSKFLSLNNKIKTVRPFPSLIKGVQYFANTIYIEDEKRAAGIDLTPANRFYECVSAKVLQLFDKNTLQSFERFGNNLDDYIVESAADLKNKMNNKKLLTQQIDYFNSFDFLDELILEFQKFHQENCYYKDATKELEIQKTLF
jgi:hypothetical protein